MFNNITYKKLDIKADMCYNDASVIRIFDRRASVWHLNHLIKSIQMYMKLK